MDMNHKIEIMNEMVLIGSRDDQLMVEGLNFGVVGVEVYYLNGMGYFKAV